MFEGLYLTISIFNKKLSAQLFVSQNEMIIEKKYAWTDENEIGTRTHLFKISLLFLSHGLVEKTKKKNTRYN